MSSGESDPGPDEVYCTNCGRVIPARANFCTECGTERDPESVATNREARPQDRGGFASWAIGFEPGHTAKNVVVGLAYFFFYPIGIPLLVYGYLTRDDPTRAEALDRLGTYAAWGFGVLLLLAGVGNATDPASIPAAVLSIGLGLFLLPPVRRALESRSDVRFARWTVVAVVLVGVVAIGAVAPNETTESADPAPEVDDPAAESTPDSDGAGTSSADAEFGVRVVYSGEWQGAVSVTESGSSRSESISGVGTRTVDLGDDVDIVSVNAQKQDDSSEELRVQILRDGEVVAEANTNSAYGVAQVSESFY